LLGEITDVAQRIDEGSAEIGIIVDNQDGRGYPSPPIVTSRESRLCQDVWIPSSTRMFYAQA
jgi:hypothetical protein